MKKLLLLILCVAIPAIASQDDQKDLPLSEVVETIASSSPLIPDHVSQKPPLPSSPFIGDLLEASDLAGAYSIEKKREDDRLAVAKGPRGCYSLDIPNYLSSYLKNIKVTFATAWQINNQLAMFAHTEQMRIISWALVQTLKGMFSNPEARKLLGNLDDYPYEQIGYKEGTNLTEAAEHARRLVWKIARILQPVNGFDADKLLPLVQLCNDQEAAFRLYPNPGASSSSSTSSIAQTDSQEDTEQVALDDTVRNIKEARAELEDQEKKRLLAEQRLSFKLNKPTESLEERRKKEQRRVDGNLSAESPTKQPRLQRFFQVTPKKQ